MVFEVVEGLSFGSLRLLRVARVDRVVPTRSKRVVVDELLLTKRLFVLFRDVDVVVLGRLLAMVLAVVLLAMVLLVV